MLARNEEDHDQYRYGSITETNVNSKTSIANPAANETEQTPLVIGNNNSAHIDDDVDNPPTQFLEEKELLQDEIAGMTKLAIPVILTYWLEMLPGIVTIILVGRMDDESGGEYEGSDDVGGGDVGNGGNGDVEMSMQKLYLDAAALAVMYVNVVALSPAFGILTALDTLCSQAHGANQPSKMGTYALTGFAIIFIVFLSSSTLIYYASSILLALGQPTEVSLLCGQFIRYMLPGIPFLYLYELIRKVYQSRNEAMPMLMAMVVNNVVNVAVGYYLVYWTEWGWMGAAVARSVGNMALLPTLVVVGLLGDKKSGGSEESDVRTTNGDERDAQLYLEVEKTDNQRKNGDEDDDSANNNMDDNTQFLHHLWEGFIPRKSLSIDAIIEFLSIGIPGMAQLMFEWCAFELVALLCGILPDREEAVIAIGANSIIMNVASMCYMLYLGASVAGSVRVGNALGAGDVHRAEIASNITMATGVLMAMLNVSVLLTFRKGLPSLFTTDLDIAEEAQQLFLIAAAFQVPDAVNGSIQGVFRGSGRMALGAMWNFAAYYIFGIPLGYVLGVKLGYGVEGLWWGMTIGLCVSSTGSSVTIVRSDWKKLALEATTRLKQ